MAAKTKVLEYPVNEAGNFMSYANEYWQKPTMVPNIPFEAELEIYSYSRGRSSATFDLRDVVTGKQYPMFLTDMLTVIQSIDIIGSRVKGHWVARKRGANYGIGYITAEEAAEWSIKA